MSSLTTLFDVLFKVPANVTRQEKETMAYLVKNKIKKKKDIYQSLALYEPYVHPTLKSNFEVMSAACQSKVLP